MNAIVKGPEGRLIDDVGEFFAPMSSDLVDVLIGECSAMRQRIMDLAEAITQERYSGALTYFIKGNLEDDGRSVVPSRIDRLFRVDGALAALNAAYWDRALKMTDVLDYMPEARRSEWREQIRCPLGKKRDRYSSEYTLQPLPEFEESTVRSTLHSLLNSRAQFLAERVEGIFRSLSREHVTNCPQGFNKRMILLRAVDSYGCVNSGTAGVINDLRCVIAKFMGRDEPKWNDTHGVISIARKDNGKWMNLDGGSLRIRIYNGVGTAHLEVHPDMAWRLNSILASLYPTAIPAEFRTKPKRARKIKDFELFDNLLPFAVLGALSSMKPGYRLNENAGYRQSKFIDIPKTLRFDFSVADKDKHVIAEAERVLEAIGGVRDKVGNINLWRFDYEPAHVLAEITCNGRIPDRKSHQFYPTPDSLAQTVVDAASVGATPGMWWLEPSCGIGNIADKVPSDANLNCYEVSSLHCEIMKAKGYQRTGARTIGCLDFLELSKDYRGGGYDRIVMNPPFDQGRWQAHLEGAMRMLKKGGRLVAILPYGAKSKVKDMKGWNLSWSAGFDGQFPGASVMVVILQAERL